jgi:chromosome segregation ATPase
MKRVLWMTITVQLFFGAYASAQSIADAARKERERQKEVHSVVTVTGTTATTASGTASTNASAAAEPAAAGKATGPTDNYGHDEKYWRTTFQKARDAIKKADEKSQLLDLKVKDLNTQLLRRDDIYNKENRLGPEITATQKQLDDARAEAAQARQRIPDLEDELRKAGGPPGWSR